MYFSLLLRVVRLLIYTVSFTYYSHPTRAMLVAILTPLWAEGGKNV